MSDNPYEAPAAAIDATELDHGISIPEEVSKRIRNAVGAGFVTGTLTLVIVLVVLATRTPLMGINAWSLCDVVLIYGLTFGIFKKSRTCAVLMFIYYVGTKILQMVSGHTYAGAIWALVFGYLYAMGIAGTFEYHRIRNEAEQP